MARAVRRFASKIEKSLDFGSTDYWTTPGYPEIIFPKRDEHKQERDYTERELLSTHWCGHKPWPNIVPGHMASGVVIASDSLDISETNREFKVIETEGYGVGKACDRFGVPFVVLRGISDFADGAKRDTPYRQIAMFNVMSYLHQYMTSVHFASSLSA